MKNRYLNLHFLLLFLGLWLAIGFSLGVSVLMGPVSWLTDAFRQRSLGEFWESFAVKGMIVLLLFISGLVAFSVLRIVSGASHRRERWLAPALCLAAAMGSLWLMLHPKEFGINARASGATARFVFGPYPTKEDLAELKDEGFAAVVSLLHPAVVPFEPRLLAKEKEAALKTGIDLIHTPMLPWISVNKESLEKIRSLATNPEGRYYFHCYLGKDRVRTAQRFLEALYPGTTLELTGLGRRIHHTRQFERGPVIKLDEDIYLTPYPTETEFTSYVLNSDIRQIVSLLDPNNPEETLWINREKEMLELFRINLTQIPMSATSPDPKRMLDAARRLRQLERPLIVHAFDTDSARAQAFEIAYRRDLPPLPPVLFQEPVEGVSISVTGPNVAVGTRPSMKVARFWKKLYAAGIRQIAFLKDPNSSLAQHDRELAQKAGLNWRSIDLTHREERKVLARDGPWYVYGFDPENRWGMPDSFERGKVERLDTDAYLIPLPTETEFKRYILNGQIRSVLSLLDPQDKDDAMWLAQERQILKGSGINFQNFPLSPRRSEPNAYLAASRKAWTLPRPLVVHAFRGDSPREEGFLQAFRGDIPALPPSLFINEPMKKGGVAVIAPNIAVGPQPMSDEFENYLAWRGIKECVFVGRRRSPEARGHALLARRAGLGWRVMDPNNWEARDILFGGGPWFLYGPKAATFSDQIASRFGPTMPSNVFSVPAVWNLYGITQAQKKLLGLGRRSLPTPQMIILLGPALILVIGLFGYLCGYLNKKINIATPYTRKIFHFLIFTMAAILHFSGGLPAVALFGILVTAAVSYAVWRGEGFAFYEAMARPSDAPHRSFFVTVPLVCTALGGILSNLFFGQLAVIGYLVAGCGDAAGEPAGRFWGRHPYRISSLAGLKSVRTIEGTAAVFIASLGAAFVGLLALNMPLLPALRIALACGLAATAVEAFTPHGLDNLTVQIAASATVFFL